MDRNFSRTIRIVERHFHRNKKRNLIPSKISDQTTIIPHISPPESLSKIIHQQRKKKLFPSFYFSGTNQHLQVREENTFQLL